jgi:hypothetical protein
VRLRAHGVWVESVALLKHLSPSLRRTSFTLVGIAVDALGHEASLTPRLDEIAARVREVLMSSSAV